MMGAVSHVYNQTVADGTATSVVRPSDWNSAHNQFQTISGNTAGTSTFSGTNLVFAGGNNVTLSMSGSTLSVMGPAIASESFGISNFGNSLGTSGVASGSGVGQFFAGGNNITLSQSVNGASATITVIGNPAATLSMFETNWGLSSTVSLGNGSLYLQPFSLPEGASFNRLMHQVSMNAGATASHSSQSTRSNQWSAGRTYALYSRGSGANSTRLESVYSNTATLSGAVAYNHSSNGASATVQHTVQFAGLSQIDSAGGVTYTTISGTSSSTTSANSSVSIANTFTNAMTGLKAFAVPFAVSLTPGNYWLGIVGASSSTSQASASTVMSMSQLVQTTQVSSYFPLMATATVSTTGFMPGQGVYSVSTTAIPATIPFTDIKAAASSPLFPFTMVNQTL